MTTFLELLKESVIIRGIGFLMYSTVILYMYATGMDVPKELVGLLGVILAWFSNAVTASVAEKAATKAVEKVSRKG